MSPSHPFGDSPEPSKGSIVIALVVIGIVFVFVATPILVGIVARLWDWALA